MNIIKRILLFFKKKKYQDKGWLEENYVDLEISISDVAKKCGSNYSMIYRQLGKYNIPIRPRGFRTLKARQSRSRYMKTRIGKLHYQWKGGRVKTSQGYILIHKPEHPFHNYDNYVLEHRLVMEKHLGRYLTKDEIVHHQNKERADNRLSNLKLFNTAKEHRVYHLKRGEKVWR